VNDFVAKYRYSAEKIFERLLGGKGDRNATDAESGEGGRNIEAERSTNYEDRDDENYRFPDALRQEQHGL
jgi:hypothetical protein